MGSSRALHLDGYFVVGPRHLLLGAAGAGFPLDLQVTRATRAPREERGRARADLGDFGEGERIRLRFEARGGAAEAVAPDDLAEILRLFARVCAQRSGFTLPLEIDLGAAAASPLFPGLLADGFVPEPGGAWVRPPGPFLPADRGAGLVEVYQDPFIVPWNFVPRERDLLELALRETPAVARWLDFGCGYGRNALALEEHGQEVFGCDLAPPAVNRCNQLSSRPGRFAVADGTALPFASASLDRVLDVGCLHCLPPAVLAGAVREIARVLAPGGRLYSRMFKPRSAAWMAAQPFTAERIGLDPDEMIAALGPWLRVERISESEDVLCVRGDKRLGISGSGPGSPSAT